MPRNQRGQNNISVHRFAAARVISFEVGLFVLRLVISCFHGRNDPVISLANRGSFSLESCDVVSLLNCPPSVGWLGMLHHKSKVF